MNLSKWDVVNVKTTTVKAISFRAIALWKNEKVYEYVITAYIENIISCLWIIFILKANKKNISNIKFEVLQYYE